MKSRLMRVASWVAVFAVYVAAITAVVLAVGPLLVTGLRALGVGHR